MYLRRFARPGTSDHQISAALVGRLDAAFTTGTRKIGAQQGFYWGTAPGGAPHHDMESILGKVEGAAASAFRELLDDGVEPTDSALPYPWPTSSFNRTRIAWWIAAQLLRTTRQRARIDELAVASGFRQTGGLANANPHLEYMSEMTPLVALQLQNRPWGIGFSTACLLTSDVPVLVLNGQDHPDQSLAVEYWDVYVPLDSHRCLFLPGRAFQKRSGLGFDHQFVLHGGHGIMLNQAMLDTAVKHVLFHPDHTAFAHLDDQRKLGLPGTAEAAHGPQYLLNYSALQPGYGVERRWLSEHPPRQSEGAPVLAEDRPDDAVLEAMLRQLDEANQGFERLVD